MGCRIKTSDTFDAHKEPIVDSAKWSAVAFATANPSKNTCSFGLRALPPSRFNSESTVGTPCLILTRNTVHSGPVSRTSDRAALTIVKFGQGPGTARSRRVSPKLRRSPDTRFCKQSSNAHALAARVSDFQLTIRRAFARTYNDDIYAGLIIRSRNLAGQSRA